MLCRRKNNIYTTVIEVKPFNLDINVMKSLFVQHPFNVVVRIILY